MPEEKFSYKPMEEKKEGLTSKLREKINETKHEAKERINPFSQTNKKARSERRDEQKELKKTEKEALRKARLHEAEERAGRRAKKEYGNAPHTSGGKSQRRGSGFGFSIEPVKGPEIVPGGNSGVFVPPDMWGNPVKQSSRPNKSVVQSPTKVTRVQSGGKEIIIKEKAEASQQAQVQKKPQYDYFDPFSEFILGPSTKQEKGEKKEKNPYDIFADL